LYSVVFPLCSTCILMRVVALLASFN
jgi:hypothetical protein